LVKFCWSNGMMWIWYIEHLFNCHSVSIFDTLPFTDLFSVFILSFLPTFMRRKYSLSVPDPTPQKWAIPTINKSIVDVYIHMHNKSSVCWIINHWFSHFSGGAKSLITYIEVSVDLIVMKIWHIYWALLCVCL